MARLQQCKELLAIFRMRLGEPTVGTFGNIYYDEINENVHELLSILNQAQDHVTWICYSANLSLLEKSIELLVEPDVVTYILPEDYIGEVSVFHRVRGQEYRVDPDNLDEIRGSTRSTSYNDYRFRSYEIRENVPLPAARGIVHTDSTEGRILAGGSAGGLGLVRVGDTVYNLTDRSETVVDVINYGDDGAVSSVDVESLEFGDANRFQVGDQFQIDMKEATRDAIALWPHVKGAGVKSFYNGTADGFSLTEDSIIINEAVATPQSNKPPSFESDERVVLRITDDSDGSVVAYASRKGLLFGKSNQFLFSDDVQLREDVSYSASIRREVDAEFMPDIDVSRIEFSGRDVSNFIAFKYARLPRKITSLEDYCEMPSWSMEAVYAYGHIIAFKKMARGQVSDPALVNEFNTQIAEIKNYRYRRDERGPHSIPILGLSGSGRGDSPFPGNYSVGFVDPFDLF